jgi:predicted MFS family arabinose efflux permease
VAYERRGRLLAVFEFSWSLAYLLGGLAVGALIARFGWQSPFVLVAGLGLIGIAALRWMLPADRPEGGHQVRLLGGFREIFTSRPAVMALAMVTFMGLANELINLEFGPWLQDSFGLELLALGGASAVVGLSELGGEGLVSLVIDRLGKRRAVAGGLALNAAAGLLLPLLGGQVGAAVLGLGLFYFSFEFLFVSTVPLLTEIVPKARGTMMAFMFAGISLGRVVGAGVNPGLHAAGFWASAAASAGINLLALWALSRVRLGPSAEGL